MMTRQLASGLPYFFQPAGLLALLQVLAARGIHTVVYSGYTLEALRLRPEPEVARALELTNLIIDGPFIAALADRAGPWTGSSNQRVIDLASGRPVRCATAPRAGGSDA